MGEKSPSFSWALLSIGMMDTSYVYHPLDICKNEIRLITIDPGYPSDELTGTISHASLEAAPDYEALSYCWADSTGAGDGALLPRPIDYQLMRRATYAVTQYSRPPPIYGTIRLRNQKFKLAVNLEAALRRLRSRKDKIVLWVDAICINQINIEERNEQVTKMRLIYQNAKRVRVWLGETHSDSSAAIHFTKSLDKFNSAEWKSELAELLRNPDTLKLLDATVNLYRRPYWRRVWVVQEVISARDITVHCGADTATWAQMLNVTNIVRKSNFEMSLALMGSSWKIEFLLNNGPATLRLDAVTGSNSIARPVGFPKWDLFTLLHEHINKEATNPKDRVYALVGLCDAEHDPKFAIDYSRSLIQVYTSVVSYLLNSKRSLNVICISYPMTSMLGLPSWVPDWTIIPMSGIIRNRNIEDIYADGSRLADARISKDEKILFAKGFCIGNVEHNGHMHKSQPTNHVESLNTFRAWRRLLIDARGSDFEHQIAMTKSMYCNTFVGNDVDGQPMSTIQLLGAWGTFLDDTSGRQSRRELSDPTDRRANEEWDKLGRMDKQLKNCVEAFKKRNPTNWRELSRAFVTTISSTMYGRTFFILDTGGIGSGANYLRVGDKVVVLSGCSFPVVLRARKDGGYVFIGEAYVDGMMKGEALEGRSMDENEEFAIW